MWYQLPYPVLLERAKGCWLWDADGNRYLDLRIGDWVVIHGHCNDVIRDAIVAQLDKAIQLGCPDWDLSYRMASMLIERMPSVERVRFLVSGTEANLLAMRLSRAFTGRTKLAKAAGSYHGHADHMVTGSTTVGIFDEVVTFPIAYGGAQAWFDVTPDLTTMSKAIGGGLPLSAVGGRAEIMDLLGPRAVRRCRAGDVRLHVRRQPGIARGRHRRAQAAHARGARAHPVARRPRAERHRRARPQRRHPAALERSRSPLRDALGTRARRRLPDADAQRPREDREPPPSR